jgi:hypothetical protein
MKKYLIILVLIASFNVSAQENKAYTATLKKYLEVSGSLHAFKTAVGSMISNFKTMNSTVPEEFWKEFEAEFLNTSMDDLVAQLSPVYQKHLTEADLQGIITFYSSPAGKKLAEKTPAIMQDSMQAGRAWGEAIGMKVMAKMKEKGY